MEVVGSFLFIPYTKRSFAVVGPVKSYIALLSDVSVLHKSFGYIGFCYLYHNRYYAKVKEILRRAEITMPLDPRVSELSRNINACLQILIPQRAELDQMIGADDAVAE